MSDKGRFQVRDGSQLGHGCCFDATVVDTTRPVVFGGEPYAPDGEQQYKVVCECLETHDAMMICLALNAQYVGFAREDVRHLRNAISAAMRWDIGEQSGDPRDPWYVALESIVARIEALLPPEPPDARP